MNKEQIEFWDKLKRWHLDDIDKCLSIDANYAATKTMLSFIDVLGAFYGGLIKYENNYYVLVGGDGRCEQLKEINGKKYQKTGSKRQFLNFTKNYLNTFYQAKYNEKSAADILYDHFRCGMIHEGHSKAGTGIFRENSSIIIKFNYEGLLVALNILALRDMIRFATFKYEKDIFDNDQPERMKRWKERYEYLMELKI